MRRNKFAPSVWLVLTAIIGFVGLSSCGGGGGGGPRGPGDQLIITPPGNRPPMVEQAFPNVTLTLDSASAAEWLSETLSVYFSDPAGGILTYAAVSGDPGVATVAVSGSQLTVTGMSAGVTSITVAVAATTGLTVTQTFSVTVAAMPPEVAPIADLALGASAVQTVGLSTHFTDTAGGGLTYTATSGDPTVAMVAVSGDRLTVTGVSAGVTSVTVTAAATTGLTVTQTFSVTVGQSTPGGMANSVTLTGANPSATIDLSNLFSNLAPGTLVYTVVSSDPSVATVIESGGNLQITSGAKGSATITITGRYPNGTTRLVMIAVNVDPTQEWGPAGTIDNVALPRHSTHINHLSSYFSHPHGDQLVFEASSGDSELVDALASGASVALFSSSRLGSTTVTVVATAPDGSTASQSYSVSVINRAPVYARGVPTGTLNFFRGERVDETDIKGLFWDPDIYDNEQLIYVAESSHPSFVKAQSLEIHYPYPFNEPKAQLLRLEGLKTARDAWITVHAIDPHGGRGIIRFPVIVNNHAPEPTRRPFFDVTVKKCESTTIDLERYFSDPDGDEIAYGYPPTEFYQTEQFPREIVNLSGELVARADIDRNMLQINGIQRGQGKLEVGAYNPHAYVDLSPVTILGAKYSDRRYGFHMNRSGYEITVTVSQEINGGQECEDEENDNGEDEENDNGEEEEGNPLIPHGATIVTRDRLLVSVRYLTFEENMAAVISQCESQHAREPVGTPPCSVRVVPLFERQCISEAVGDAISSDGMITFREHYGYLGTTVPLEIVDGGLVKLYGTAREAEELALGQCLAASRVANCRIRTPGVCARRGD